jgi:hypothetical protein
MTRQQAINAKCKDCIYDTMAPGNWRQQVTACTVISCPLYEHRPRSVSGTRAEREARRAARSASTVAV